MDLEKKCQRYFGTTNFYEVLNVDKDANEKDIKKSYHKLSLIVHPDKVEEHYREAATEKFKVLCKIHSILQDKDKRRIYDDHGYFDEDTDAAFNWRDYWLSMFKKIDLNDIKKYEGEYIGSETERSDIKWAYEASKGNMNFILEMVAFSNFESEARILEIVREMVDNGEVEEYERFFNESKAKRLRRKRKFEKERKEAEIIDLYQVKKRVYAKNDANVICNSDKDYSPKKARKRSQRNSLNENN